MRGFLIKTKWSNGYYCSKCGKLLPKDRYNMEKHSTICWKRPLREADILKEHTDQVYTIEDQHQKVFIIVSSPHVESLPDHDDSIAAVKWETLHKFSFYNGKNGSGICFEGEKNIPGTIIDLIRDGEFLPGMEEEAAQIIHRVFPEVLAVYDLRMFAYICTHKGFRYCKVLPEKEEKALLKPQPGDQSPKTEIKGMEDTMFSLQAKVYRYSKETFILRVTAQWKGENTVFLFSRGYAACSDFSRVEGFLERGCRMTESSRKAAAFFDKIYPENLLSQYMKYSDNILVPLIAPDYHKGMELAAKSGTALLAENMRSLWCFDWGPSCYDNLRHLFGLPTRVLRRLSRECITDEDIKRLEEVFRYNPEFLNFKAITPSMMEYFQTVNVTHSDMPGIADKLTDEQQIRILRFLSKHPGDGRAYCDYLQICEVLEEYVFGLIPSIPIAQARDEALKKVKNLKDIELETRFRTRAESPDYLKLTTCMTEKEKEIFKDDDYVVIAPRQPRDLLVEGIKMHNCVSTYTNGVANGYTYIYFLRRKEKLDKSFGTLEVSPDFNGNLRLSQAKAFANGRLPESAQKYLAKWCKINNIIPRALEPGLAA